MKQSIFACLLGFLISFYSAANTEPSTPAIQLASVFSGDVDIKDYLVSEKLDGVRAYWDGKVLRSRRGYVFAAPTWFSEDFGSQPLDGELWLGRGKFEQTLSIVSKLQGDEQSWHKVRFMIFDLPDSELVFAQRVAQMQRIVKAANSRYLQMIPQHTIDNHIQLQAKLTDVVNGGGEGLMLHKKRAYYQVGRTQNILKLKPHQNDEAIVLAHFSGKGKYRDKMGAILVENTHGVQFKIGTGFSVKQRVNPPEIGSTITYKFFGLTQNGTPRFASFVRAYKPL